MYSYKLDDQLNAEQQKLVFGGEVCMWSELTNTYNLDAKLWPRAAAAAEVKRGTHGGEKGVEAIRKLTCTMIR